MTSQQVGSTIVATASGAAVGTVGADYRPITDETQESNAALGAGPEILEVGWGIQVKQSDGTWADHAPGTWLETDEDATRREAAGLEDNGWRARVFIVVKMVDPKWEGEH